MEESGFISSSSIPMSLSLSAPKAARLSGTSGSSRHSSALSPQPCALPYWCSQLLVFGSGSTLRLNGTYLATLKPLSGPEPWSAGQLLGAEWKQVWEES